MATLTLSTELPAPVAVVWEELRHIDRHVHWMADAESITFTTEQHEGVGTQFRCRTKVGPLVTTDVMTITAWEPERTMGVRHSGLITGEGAFHLVAKGDATDMTWAETLIFPWWAGGPLGALVATPILRAIWRRNLRRLQQRF
jgi:carbon monoxide dehydrogenase subunit G